MTRRRPQTSISLFPFLAVLVCAMGSLILLLLVMTRKIRHEQSGDGVPPAMAALPDAQSLDRTQEIADMKSHENAIRLDISRLQQQATDLQQTVDAQQKIVDDLRSQYTAMETALPADSIASDGTVATNARDRVVQLRRQQKVLQQQLEEQEKQLLAKQLRLKSVTQAASAAQLKLQQVNSGIIALRQQVQEAQQAAASVGTETVLEFTNTTGTTRTPIIVEVKKDGYQLQPSGILIKTEDMEGFPISDTPLMAAILAIHRERASSSLTSQPYVLLLVRPTGSEAFYPAQGILAHENVHFGYELIDAKESFAVSESSPKEITAARQALDEAYRRRERIYANLRFMAQSVQQSGTTGAPDPARRGLSIGADGMVRTESRAAAELPSRGNYAGGVAPPPGFYERREAAKAAELARAAQMLNRGDSSGVRPSDEAVVRQFVQHDTTDAATRAAANGQMTHAEDSTSRSTSPQPAGPAGDFRKSGSRLPDQISPEGTLPAPGGAAVAVVPEYGSKDRAENMLFSNGEQQFFPRSTSASVSAPDGPKPITAEEQFAAMMAGTSTDGAASTASSQLHVPSKSSASGIRSYAGGRTGSEPANRGQNTSNNDNDLLGRLQSTDRSGKIYATPVSVIVFLDDQHMTVGQQPAIPVATDSLDEALTALLRNVETEVSDVRKTPHEKMMPVVKFIVSPGGERWRIPLSSSLKHLGIPHASAYELTPHIETTSAPGRASY